MMPRADRAHRLTDRELKKLEERIAKAYIQAYDEIAEKADKYFNHFAKLDKEMVQKVKDKKITFAQYREWRKNKMLIGKRWNNMLEVIGKDMLNAEKIAMSYVNDTKLNVYAINANFATYQIEHDSRIDTSFTLYNKDTVKTLINENPRLLPNYKPNEEKLLLWNKQHINSAITQAVLQGKSIPDVAKSLEKVTDMDARAAVRNARTAVTCAQNKARFDSYERAEELGIKMKKVWLATLDDRTRESHVELDGEEVEINEKFSNGLMFPADPDGEPSQIYNCRCRMITQIDKYRTDWSDLKNRNNDKLGSMSYDEWKETHKPKAKIERQESSKKTNIAINKNGEEIPIELTPNSKLTGERLEKNIKRVNETKQMLVKLTNEYNTYITSIKKGSIARDHAAGLVEVDGSMRLSTLTSGTVLHEFAHGLASSPRVKFDLADDTEKSFIKDIKKLFRQYKSEYSKDTRISISAYSLTDADEFMAEGFSLAKSRELGLTINENEFRIEEHKYSEEILRLINKYFKR